MAFLSETTIEHLLVQQPIIAFTRHTLTDPTAFKQHLSEIRRQGFAVSDQEMNTGAVGVAAPIYNAQREVAAGLTLAGPSSLLAPDRFPEYIEAIQVAAAECSARLGYHPRPERLHPTTGRERRKVLSLR